MVLDICSVATVSGHQDIKGQAKPGEPFNYLRDRLLNLPAIGTGVKLSWH